MSGGAGDRPGPGALRVLGDRPASRPAVIVGGELVALLDKMLVLSVEPDLQVRVRVYDAGEKLLVDVGTTAIRALKIAALFKAAAERADPSLIVRQIEASP